MRSNVKIRIELLGAPVNVGCGCFKNSTVKKIGVRQYGARIYDLTESRRTPPEESVKYT